MAESGIHSLPEERTKELLGQIGRELAREMLQAMFTIGAFEEKAEELYAMGKVHGTRHLSIGQEAVAVAASNSLRRGYDHLPNHHRGLGTTSVEVRSRSRTWACLASCAP